MFKEIISGSCRLPGCLSCFILAISNYFVQDIINSEKFLKIHQCFWHRRGLFILLSMEMGRCRVQHMMLELYILLSIIVPGTLPCKHSIFRILKLKGWQGCPDLVI